MYVICMYVMHFSYDSLKNPPIGRPDLVTTRALRPFPKSEITGTGNSVSWFVTLVGGRGGLSCILKYVIEYRYSPK